MESIGSSLIVIGIILTIFISTPLVLIYIMMKQSKKNN